MRARTQLVPHFAGRGRIVSWERPVHDPGAGELLLQVRANALCGTDRDQLHNGSDVTPGHEAAGDVVAAGPGTSTQVGTSGVVFLMDFCGECRSCRAGATNQCLAKRADMGFTDDGGLGQFERIHETNFFATGPELDPAEATLLLDVMGTTSQALARAAAVRPDIQSVLVAGAGPVGLGVVAMARLVLGPGSPILITDLNPYRLELAERLGAVPVDLRHRKLASALRDAGLAEGADVAIDTAGRESARRSLLDGLGRRGVLVCVGHGQGLTISVSDDLIGPERAVVGSEYFRYEALSANDELLRRNRAYLGQIITHRFGIGDLEEAYRLFLAGETGKVVIEQ
ncbi:MAG: alcohol dehydrogenase catalytic domain-containing protein [Chloroflexi bacterium]|nr:alcohol dehydrogenase catalytic domain-containing protein [Chloroflexota bacterium]